MDLLDQTKDNLNILVTGCSGFVGTELVRQLKNTNHKIIGIDIKTPTVPMDVFHLIDLTQPFKLEEKPIDLCIHLASAVGGILFNTNKQEITEYNHAIDESVVDICKCYNCEHMIFFSTINVFEWQEPFLHSKLLGNSIYSRSKIQSEDYLSEHLENLMVIRPTNIFGKDQIDRRHGEYGQSHVIPELLNKIDENDILEIFGDGSQTRNFVHVKDLCLFVLFNLFNVKDHKYFNLRSDITISILRLACELMQYKKKWIPVEFNEDYMSYERMKMTNFDMIDPILNGWMNTIKTIQEGLDI